MFSGAPERPFSFFCLGGIQTEKTFGRIYVLKKRRRKGERDRKRQKERGRRKKREEGRKYKYN